MALRQRIEQRQKPVFTQGLRQSIEILELPLLELKRTVESQLAENPVLEEVQSPAEQKIREDEYRPNFSGGNQPESTDGFENLIPGKMDSLADFLSRQLRINAEDAEQYGLGELIIQHIDENGYLRKELSAIAREAGVDEKIALKALELIQTFDPQGVGARDLKECLLIQLKRNDKKNDVARILIENYLSELADKNFNKLCKKLGCSPEELSECIAKIHSLEPKPGRSFNCDEVTYIIPDIIIEEKDGALMISVKDDILPLVRVNPLYKNMLKSEKVDSQTKEFIRERAARANNLILAIKNRKNTLLKIVSLIAETQKEAILDGLEKLNPLSLKEIAEKAELHESTISRIVTNKYMQAPCGIFPLKKLFSFGLKTTDGEDVATQRIKTRILEYIENENKSKPLKDHELAALILGSEKITLARRTIAKYRESLKIPTASKRKPR